MPGYNHYTHCPCGWCVKLSGRCIVNWAKVDASRILKEKNYREGSYASCFVNPNASCPVCQQRVFFYMNAYGSRVYFDELGAPWQKHGCTDRGRGYAIRKPGQNAVYAPMERRSRGEIEEVFDALMTLSIDPRKQRQEHYSASALSVFIVIRAFKRGFVNYLESRELVGGEGNLGYFRFTSQNFEATVGDIFSVDFSIERATISFPNLNDDGKALGPFRVWDSDAQEFEREAKL